MRTMKILLLLSACFSAGVVTADFFGRWIEADAPSPTGFADVPQTAIPSSIQPESYPATQIDI